MAVRIEVDYHVLRTAENGWEVAAEDLSSAADRLALVSGAGLPPQVGAEVDAFAQRWLDEVRAVAGLATGARVAFGLVGADYRITDRGLAEHIRSLLPWGQRHDAIGAAR